MCHPAVLKQLQAVSCRQMDGYGEDVCCAAAASSIRKLCGREDVAVHFLTGGTQTNLIVTAAALRPHQAVIGAESAHIQVHETGAIEATGHKVLSVPSDDGKLTAKQIRSALQSHRTDPNHEHIAQPKMVYISQPTEWGTTYSLAELEEISNTCRESGVYLYVDGARLGYALTAADSDVTMEDLARLTDAFYIGGTKVGAMFGEALVICNGVIAEDFRYIMKQRGGMLAKGWLLGAQFEALLQDDLYFEISRKANCFADKLRSVLTELGYPLVAQNRTNQVFAILPDAVLTCLQENVTYSVWEKADAKHTVVRFCTSWATTDEQMNRLCSALRRAGESM